ncbi:MAG: glycosyltransferase [Gammaproteobacteria bacterium]
MRIVHIISGLDTGGAELFLERLARSLNDGESEHVIVSLTGLGTIGERMRHDGIRVYALKSGWYPRGITSLIGLRRILKETRPDLVQGWLYLGNIGTHIARRFGGLSCPIVWNIRHCLDGWEGESALLRAQIRLGGKLSGTADRILFNSTAAARQHERFGYPRSKAVIIPNGFDCRIFSPNRGSRARIRQELGITQDAVVVGHIGRYHPIKDHVNFLRAARRLASEAPMIRFMLAGRGVNWQNPAVRTQIEELQLGGHLSLLGERDDVPALMNAMDIHVSSSWSESFPNAIGEAMACGIPCVVTDVGASAELVAETGIVVPARSPDLLAQSISRLIQAGAVHRKGLGEAARDRILQNYTNAGIARQYAELYRSVLHNRI